jgi:hypothetical protein
MKNIFLIIPLLISMAGCKGETGPTGAQGLQGPAGSPYVDLWEDFEAGNFTSYRWQRTGDAQWEISTDHARFGSKGAASGTITHSQKSTLSISPNLPRAGLVSFYCTVSCEANFDWLKWELDGIVVNGLSGVAAQGSWFSYSFAVPPGQHTIKWYYQKDASVSNGLDKVYVDGILLTNYDTLTTRKVGLPPPGTVLLREKD